MNEISFGFKLGDWNWYEFALVSFGLKLEVFQCKKGKIEMVRVCTYILGYFRGGKMG